MSECVCWIPTWAWGGAQIEHQGHYVKKKKIGHSPAMSFYSAKGDWLFVTDSFRINNKIMYVLAFLGNHESRERKERRVATKRSTTNQNTGLTSKRFCRQEFKVRNRTEQPCGFVVVCRAVTKNPINQLIL